MALQVLDGPLIAAGESLSSGIDCSAGPLVRITMPAEWEPSANLTFELSSDGTYYNPLYDVKGNEITIVVVPGSAVRIPLEWSTLIAFIKFRSGTSKHPVVQKEGRLFAVAIEVPDQEPAASSRR
jgi:hypothetical protein